MKPLLSALILAAPLFSTPVYYPTDVPAGGTWQTTDFYPVGVPWGVWETAPYDGPVPEATGYGFICCYVILTGPGGNLPLSDMRSILVNEPALCCGDGGPSDGDYVFAENWEGGYSLIESGYQVPLTDPVPEPGTGSLLCVAALIAGVRRTATRKRSNVPH
jgi:hypothetical protein